MNTHAAHPACSDPQRHIRRQQLEHAIAIEAARALLGAFCFRICDDDGEPLRGEWLSTNNIIGVTISPPLAGRVARAVEYLDLCGLLQHHSSRPGVVRIRIEALPE